MEGAWQIKGGGGGGVNELFTTINADCIISCYENSIEGWEGGEGGGGGGGGGGFKPPTPPPPPPPPPLLLDPLLLSRACRVLFVNQQARLTFLDRQRTIHWLGTRGYTFSIHC